MRLTGTIAIAAAVLAFVGGCTTNSGEASGPSWRHALKRQGVNPHDWQAYKETWQEVCDSSADELGFFVASSIDADTTRSELRTNVRYACPDRMDELRHTLRFIDSTSHLCETPLSDLSEKRREMALAVC